MSLSYVRLRQMHFHKTVGKRFRGMARTAIVVLAFFGSSGVLAIAGLMIVLANGLMALTYPYTGPLERLGVLFGWQYVTLGLLWSLRTAIFVREAEPFLSTLPIPDGAVWRADLLIVMQCYSVLWLPLIWLMYTLWARTPPMQALSASTSYLVMIGAGMMLNVSLLRGAYRRATVMTLPMLVLMVIRPQSAAGALILLGAAAFAVTVAIRPRPARLQAVRPAGRSRANFERLTVASALVLPVSLHALRESLVVRGGSLLGAWALAMTLLAGHTPSVGLATALLIGLTAITSAALYRLPVLIRGTVFNRLDFLSGHRRFRWRVTLLSSVSSVLLFAVCLGTSWATSSHAIPIGVSDAALPRYPLYLYTGLFVLGALSANWTRDAMRWLIPTAHIVLMLILLTAALS